MLLIRGKEREKQGTLWVKKRTENAREKREKGTGLPLEMDCLTSSIWQAVKFWCVLGSKE